MENTFLKLPEKRYSVIYLDPPWNYGGKIQYDSSAKVSHYRHSDMFISKVDDKYPTMKLEDLKKLDVKNIAADDCVMFMWVTNPHLAQGIELAKHWNFEYKTVAFVWDKMNHNPGHYTLSYCELCLLFKKGKIPTPRGSRNEKQLVRIPRTEHSRKPIEVKQAIERMWPTLPKIELFARCAPDENWDVWGNEVTENALF